MKKLFLPILAFVLFIAAICWIIWPPNKEQTRDIFLIIPDQKQEIAISKHSFSNAGEIATRAHIGANIDLALRNIGNLKAKKVLAEIQLSLDRGEILLTKKESASRLSIIFADQSLRLDQARVLIRFTKKQLTIMISSGKCIIGQTTLQAGDIWQNGKVTNNQEVVENEVLKF